MNLSTQNNTKLLQQLKSVFKPIFNAFKSINVVTYLDYLTKPSCQGSNRLFVLSYENITDTTAHKGYYFPKVKIKDYNAMIDGKTFLISQ